MPVRRSLLAVFLAAACGSETTTAPPPVVEVGPPAQLSRYRGEEQTAAVGESLRQPLTVRIVDRAGNYVPGAPVTFTVIGGGGSIDGSTVLSDGDGFAVSGPWTLGPAAGLQQVRAKSGSAEVVFSARAHFPPIGLQGQLAIVSERDDRKKEIQVIDAASKLRRPLTASRGSDYDPAWSPDGSQLAFVSERDGTVGIYVLSANGSNVRFRTRGFYPAWSPTGGTIAFSTLHNGGFEIATIANGDTAIAFVTDYPGYNSQPSWSPDGRQLAYVSDWAFYDTVFDIYTINANGTDRTQRSIGSGFWPNLTYYLHPTWSPDGSMIAFVYGRIINESDMRFKVAVMSAQGSSVTDLAWAGDILWGELLDPGSLTWAPNGSGIAFTFVDCDLLNRNGCSKTRSVKYVSLDGARLGTIADNAHSPSWKR